MPPASLPAAAAITPGPRTESRTSQRGRRCGAKGSKSGAEEAGGDDAGGSVGPALRLERGVGWLMREMNRAVIRKIAGVTMTVHLGFALQQKKNKKQKRVNTKQARLIIAGRKEVCQLGASGILLLTLEHYRAH